MNNDIVVEEDHKINWRKVIEIPFSWIWLR